MDTGKHLRSSVPSIKINIYERKYTVITRVVEPEPELEPEPKHFFQVGAEARAGSRSKTSGSGSDLQ